ncbi:MAG: TonB-dependent receptor [Oligoflexia bacterium]|nr:TonB-dependent receptor [Oligoflexia bacterium]
MDLRVLALLIFSSLTHAQTVFEPPMQVSGDAVDRFQFRQTHRPVETIKREQLRLDTKTQLSDSLNQLPGVQSRFEGSPLISIRGSQSSFRNLVLQDGVPLSFADGIGFNPLFIADESLESMTILKGPGSSELGRDAMHGAVAFRSKILQSPEVRLSAGSFESKKVYLATPLTQGPVRSQATLYHTTASGYRPRSDKDLKRATLRVFQNADSYRWSVFSLGAQEIGSAPGSTYFSSADSFNNWGIMSGASAQIQIFESLEVQPHIGFKKIDQRPGSTAPNITTGGNFGLGIKKTLENYSVDGFYEGYNETFTASYFPGGALSQQTHDFGGGLRWDFNESLTLLASARYSGSEQGALSPAIGLVGMSSSEEKFFASYAEGHHPPSLSQKFGESLGFRGNPALVGEKSRELSLGFEKSWSEVTTYFEAFSRDSLNLIENQNFSGTYIPQNISSARATGFESTTRWNPNSWILMGSLSYLKNENTQTKEALTYSPAIQASLSIGQVLDRWSWTLSETYWGDYFARNTNNQLANLGQWNTLDLQLGYQVDKIQLLFAINNIFNQPRELTLGYPEAPRNFQLTVSGVF